MTLSVTFGLTAQLQPDQFDFSGWLIPVPSAPKVRIRLPRPWLLPDGRAVLDRRPLPFLKRTFLHLVLLRVHGRDLRRWM